MIAPDVPAVAGTSPAPTPGRWLTWCAGLACIAVVASGLLMAVAYRVWPSLAESAGPSVDLHFAGILGILVLSPLVETWVLGWMLRRLLAALVPVGGAIVLAALAWGGVHELAVRGWFFGTVPSFAVFAWAWHRASAWSQRAAYWTAASVHVLVNAVVMSAVAIGTD